MIVVKNFEQYLAIHKTENGKSHTHTRIGDKKLGLFGGSYTIQPEEWEDFMKKYFNNVFEQGKKEYLTEKQLIEDGPILLDFDFRYKTEIKEKQHKEEHIIDMLYIYAEKIAELVAVREDVNIDIFVMEKSSVNCLDDKTKDGIHIIIGIKMHKGLQLLLRDKILDSNLKDVMDLPLTNSWEDVLDEGVTKGCVNWQMYGSRKPDNLAYMMKYHYTLTYNINQEPNIKSNLLLNFNIEKYILKLSARYTEHPEFIIKDNVSSDFELAKERLTSKSKNFVIPSGLLTPPPEQNDKTIETDEHLDLLFNYIGNGFIKAKKIVSYQDRLCIRFALKSNGYDKQHYIEFCNLREGKGKDNADEDWEKLSITETTPLYVLEGLAKRVVPNNYKQWLKKRDDKIKEIGKEMLLKSISEQNENKEDESQEQLSYEKLKERFEKIHAKIINKSLFIKQTEDNIIFMKENGMTTSYKHLKYYQPKYNKENEFICMESKSFIKSWYEDPDIKKYEDMAIYPPPLVCPTNIFNLWKPFAITKYKDNYVKDEEGLQMFKDHMKILCGNNEEVTEYIIKWIAQMFQYPATKTIIPTFISDEGAGKGSLIELLSRLMGYTKTLVTTTPSRDVWGSFNGLMSENFLVNLNEMSKKETIEAEGKIKGLITDPQLTINKKGIDPYTIQSFHRFITTTNSEDPIKTKKGDRRNLIIESSNEKCNDNEYFKNLRVKLENIDVMRTIYDYLMSIENLNNFHSIPMPKTSYQNDMKEQNRCFYDRWIEDYIRKYQDENVENLELKGDSQFKLFKEWCITNGINYETSSIKMALGIKRLNIEGIKCGVAKRDGNYTQYNINKLKKYYKIGCLINLDN